MPKNIVVCCDGTGNQVSTDPTNVMRLWSALDRDENQVAFYDPGVGTLGDPRILTPIRKHLRKKLDGAIGLSIRDNFIEAYSFVARNYQPDDRIFFFGFSRGAYTARAVAAAIHLFGLIQAEHENLTPYVWRSFSNDDGDEDAKTLFSTAARFHKRFTRKVPIHFIGVWDTVSSFGLITNFRTLPHTRKNPSARVVRHAVAIDERRACFRANLFDPGVAGQDYQEVWFAGVHSDIGGGYPEADSALAKVPLRWMMKEAALHGLRLGSNHSGEVLADPAPDSGGPSHESLVGWWKLLELLPQRRFDYSKGGLAWHLPNLFGRRQMERVDCPPPVVHASVRERMNRLGYRPKNLAKNCLWLEEADAPQGTPP
jgi:uncharacterized protein (DUF2235 family)